MPKLFSGLKTLPRNQVVVGITTASVFLISLLAQDGLNRLFAHRHLTAQAQTLLSIFEQSVNHARDELASLPPLEDLACESGVSLVLAQRTFRNDDIRWMAVEQGGQLVCRGHVIGMTLRGENATHQSTHRLDPSWFIESLKTPDQHHGLFVVHERGQRRYIASLEPPNMRHIGDAVCEGCVAYELSIEGQPRLQLSSPALQELVRIEQEVSSRSPHGLDLRIQLTAGDRYLTHHRLQGWLATVLIAMVLGALAGALMHRLLRNRGSMDFLIREALRQRAFVPYYQPIVDSRDGRLMGAEALIRWVTPDGKVVPPGQFIPYAEESGLIQPITLQLTEQITADVARLQWANSPRFVSINLVPEQLENMDYVRHLLGLIQQHQLSPHNISVEITERRQFEDMAAGKLVLQALTQAGIEVKLDDAGTGFGGFAYIQELPIGTLKIDKMFVDTLRHGDDAKRPVLDAIVEFARISKLETIAEGVETLAQVRQLADLGVHAIQGYVFGKPMPLADFEEWARTR